VGLIQHGLSMNLSSKLSIIITVNYKRLSNSNRLATFSRYVTHLITAELAGMQAETTAYRPKSKPIAKTLQYIIVLTVFVLIKSDGGFQR